MPMFGGVKGNSVLPRVDETTDKLSTAPETSSKSRNRFGWGGANRGGSATAKDNRRGSYGKQRRPSAAAVAAAAALMGELEEVDDPADLEAVVGNSSAVSVLDSSNHSYQSATSTSTYSKYLQYPQPPGVKSILKTTTSSSSHTNSASSGEESSSSIQLSALAEEVPPKQQPNTVSFDRIVVAEYAIMLGNAPYAEGAPIAMGPEKVGEATYHLEDYEDLRAMPSHKKKSTGLRLGPEQRSQILISQGYTQSDIANANRKTLRSRTQLAKNLQQQQQGGDNSNKKNIAFNRVNAQAFANAMKGFRKFAVGNKTGKDFADYPADGSLPPEFVAALEKTLMTSDNSSTGDRSSDGYYHGDYDSDEDLVSVLSEIEANASRKKAAARKQKVSATPGPPSSSKRLSRT